MAKLASLEIEKKVERNKNRDKLFAILGLLATLVGMLTLVALLVDLALDGLARLQPHFFTSYPSRFAGQAGILSSWVGTILVMIVTAAAAIPVGVGAGVYLEEYAPKNWLTAIIEINIANLAGVPSIVYGLMALGLFVYQFRVWTKHPLGGIDSRAVDPAHRHCRDAGIHPRRAREHERSGLCSRRH
jgi:phosphate transport system permease protein